MWEFSDGKPYDLKPSAIHATEEEILNALNMLEKDATVVLWNIQGIFWGRWEGHKISFHRENPLYAPWLEEMRVFNNEEELHLIKMGNHWLKRYIRDDSGNPYVHIDCCSPLWGNTVRDAGAGYVKVEDEERNLEMTIPVIGEGYGDANTIGLVTRNYIGKLSTGQAGYVDFRYMDLVAL